MLLHAYRRREAIEVSLLGEVVFFAPNARGDVVAEVPQGPVLERLLEVPEAYRPYENVADEVAQALSLDEMSAKQLRVLAKERGIDLPGSNGVPVADLRRLLAQGLESAQ